MDTSEHPLEDCRLKVAQAMTDFNALSTQIREFFQDDSLRIASQVNRETGDEEYKIERLPKLPRWGVPLSAIGHHTRSALDQLVYALACEGGGNPEVDRTTFPIYDSRDDYLRVGRDKLTARDRALAGVEEKWRKEIDDLQPYNRGDDAHNDPLAVLAGLSNRDKHRTTHTAHVFMETPAYIVWAIGTQYTERLKLSYNLTTKPQPHFAAESGPMHTGRRHPQGGGVLVQPKPQIGGKLGMGVIFGGPIVRTAPDKPPKPGYMGLGDIKKTITWAESILHRFEPAFQPGI